MSRGGASRPACHAGSHAGILLPLAVPAFAQQSALSPAGPQAAHIDRLWWWFLAVLTIVFLIVIALTLLALTRRHRGIEQEPLERVHLPSGATEQRLVRTVAGATVVTILIL